MKALKVLALAAVLGAGVVAEAAAPPASLTAIPEYINYQGRLVNPGGVPYSNTTHKLDLRLWTAASGGVNVWAERYLAKTEDGYFSILLGSGGTPLGGLTNKLWKQLWRTDAGSPDNLFLAVTVGTDTNGQDLASPVEASPRQQFLTAPFAYRAHQSQYANKALDLFEAAGGVQTPSLTATGEIAVSASARLATGKTLYANAVRANAGNWLNLSADSGRGVVIAPDAGTVRVGYDMPSFAFSSDVILGFDGFDPYPGTHTQVRGDPIDVIGSSVNLECMQLDIVTPNPVKFNSQAMFIHKAVFINVNAALSGSVATGISSTDYDQVVVGFSSGGKPPRSVYVNGSTAWVTFETATSAVVSVRILAIRKGLIDLQ